MLITFIILTAIFFILTFITLWRYEAWWVRGWDFPRLQLGLLALLLLLVEIALLDFSQIVSWILALVSFMCVAYQAWWILPYTRLFRREVKSATQPKEGSGIAILASNVLT